MKRTHSWAMGGVLVATFLMVGCAGRRVSDGAGAEASRDQEGLSEPGLTQRVDAYTQYALGVSAELNGKPEEALTHYLAAARAQPAQKSMIVQVVGRLLQAGQAAAAVELLERATALPTADAELFAWLGLAHVARGEMAAAIAANQAAIDRDPRIIGGYRNLALLYLQNRQPDAALEVLNRAALREDASAGFLVALAELYTGHSQLYPEQAERCRLGILACLDRAVALELEDPQLRQWIADGFRLNGRLEQAETILLELIEEQPGLPLARETLAAVVLAQDRPEEALKVIEEARKRFDNSFQFEFLAAVAQARLGRYEEALRCFGEARELAEKSATGRLNQGFYFQFGAAAERQGDFAQAELHFRKALDQEPDFAEALNYLGYMWAERGENLEEARELIERAVELEPENGAFLDSLAWVLFKLGQPAQALLWIRKAVQFTEEADPTLYDHLGDILSAAGEMEKAREAWQRSLDLKPDEAVREKLEAVRAPVAPDP